MKTLTIALKEDTYEEGQAYARQNRISLDRLLRKLLEETLRKAPVGSSCEKFFAAADRAGGCSDGRKWHREDLYRV